MRIRPATRSTGKVLRPAASGVRRPVVSEACDGRFACPMSDQSFKDSMKERIPKNTAGNTKWATNLWQEWRKWRQFRPESKRDEMWPIPSLRDGSVEYLDYWLARFITEVRRQDNKAYNAGNMFYNLLFYFPN